MSQTLKIKAFFFNAKTDYLPYYKQFTISIEETATAKELLAKIQECNENFSYPKQKLVFKINDLVVDAKEKIANIVARLGTELTIDPVNSYRSNDGLRINDSDFMKSFSLLEPYATENDLKEYKKMYGLHYASETEKYDREYIGDAIIVLACNMIKAGSEHQKEILKAISQPHAGLLSCEYENNLFNAEYHADKIETLKQMVKNTSPSSFQKFVSRFVPSSETKEVSVLSKSIENLEEKSIGYYMGKPFPNINHAKDIYKAIEAIDSRQIDFDRADKLCGLCMCEDNKPLALKKAGTLLLNAFDAGVEVLVVEDINALLMFEDNFCAIEAIMGRKMIGLELLSTIDFMAQTKISATS